MNQQKEGLKVVIQDSKALARGGYLLEAGIALHKGWLKAKNLAEQGYLGYDDALTAEYAKALSDFEQRHGVRVNR